MCEDIKKSYIDNPNQLLMFDPLAEVKETAYSDGYNTGAEWDAAWMPGGPDIYTGKKLSELRAKHEARNAAWKRGFNDGLSVRLETSPEFAAWWQNRNKYKFNERRFKSKN